MARSFYTRAKFTEEGAADIGGLFCSFSSPPYLQPIAVHISLFLFTKCATPLGERGGLPSSGLMWAKPFWLKFCIWWAPIITELPRTISGGEFPNPSSAFSHSIPVCLP